MTSWRAMIREEMDIHNDSFDNVEGCTLTEEELDSDFDGGFGVAEGKPFTLWTLARVYFPVVYDGSEWVGSAPRHPCAETTAHQGGE